MGPSTQDIDTLLRLLGASDVANAEHKLRNILSARTMALQWGNELRETLAHQRARIDDLIRQVAELTALDASMRETIALQEEHAEQRERELFEHARCLGDAEATVERQREYIATLEQRAKPEPPVFEPFDDGALDSEDLMSRIALFLGSGAATREHYKSAADAVLRVWEDDAGAVADLMHAIGWSGE